MASPLLFNYVIHQLQRVPGWKPEPFIPDKRSNELVIDGLALVPLLYPPSWDWVVPSWREMFVKVKQFCQRLTEKGFTVVVFFSIQPEQDGKFEDRVSILRDQSQRVSKLLADIDLGNAKMEETGYFTPIRTIISCVCKAFQHCEVSGVTVKVTSLDAIKAITAYCNSNKQNIHAVLGTDLSEALIYPTPALISVHPSLFDWPSFWQGKPISVYRVRRFHIYQSLVPAAMLPVFASLVGNPLFSRDLIKGFFDSSEPWDIFGKAIQFIKGCAVQIQNDRGRASPEEFSRKLYGRLTRPTISQEAFVDLFKKSCNAYTPKPLALSDIVEIDIDTIFHSPSCFFEPLLERSAKPSPLLLRPTRVKYLSIHCGEGVYDEIYLDAKGDLVNERVQTKKPEISPEKVALMPLFERMNLFEGISQIELTPIMKFNGEGAVQDVQDSWFYLTVLSMSKLQERSAFLRREELEKLVAQYCSLGGSEYHNDFQAQGTVSVEQVSLCTLFHCTLQHLGKLNKVCGSPFPSYKEWELFDGNIFALPLEAIRRIKSFSEARYSKIITMIENSLPNDALLNTSVPPAIQQFLRVRPARPTAATPSQSPSAQEAAQATTSPSVPVKKVSPKSTSPPSPTPNPAPSPTVKKQAPPLSTVVTAAQLEKQLGAPETGNTSPFQVASMFKYNVQSGGVRNVIDLVKIPPHQPDGSNLQRWQQIGTNDSSHHFHAKGGEGIALQKVAALVYREEPQQPKKKPLNSKTRKWVPCDDVPR